jgi:hypothetical protein
VADRVRGDLTRLVLGEFHAGNDSGSGRMCADPSFLPLSC